MLCPEASWAGEFVGELPSPDCYYAAIDLLLYISNTQDTHTFTFTGSVDVPPGVDPKLHTSVSTNDGLLAYSDSTWYGWTGE